MTCFHVDVFVAHSFCPMFHLGSLPLEAALLPQLLQQSGLANALPRQPSVNWP